MTESPHVQFRADAELVDAVEQLAETEDISKSEAWRTLAREGLVHTADGDLDHVAERQQLEQIKNEEHTRQRRAWFRANVGSYLLKCWNGGLSPEEAADALHGYRREAEEMHDDPDLIEYLNDGLRVYDAAYPDNGAKLSTWIKQRGPNREIDIDATGAESEDAVDVDAEADHPTYSVEEAAEEFHAHGWDPENITPSSAEHVEGSHYDVRERLRELNEDGGADE